jgi:uncharacterized membrane protein
MIEHGTALFSAVCGQYTPHTWVVGGWTLPCCQRCMGLYAGAAMALICQLLFRPSPSAGYRWVHGLFLLLMIPLGLHWVPQNDIIRCFSGQLFGFGVVAYLWFLPSSRLSTVARIYSTSGLRHYGIALLLSLLLVPVLVFWNIGLAAKVLVVLALAGASALCALVILHMALGVFATMHWAYTVTLQRRAV